MPDNSQKPFHIEKQADLVDIDCQLDHPKVREAVKAIVIELSRAERIRPEWPEDLELQLATIADQFEKACRETNFVQHPTAILKHKLHCVAAMCIRTLKNMEG